MEKELEKMSLDEFFKYIRKQAENDEYAYLLKRENEANAKEDKRSS